MPPFDSCPGRGGHCRSRVAAVASLCGAGSAAELRSGFIDSAAAPCAGAGCYYDNASGPVMYIGGNIYGDKHITNVTDGGPEGCCELCRSAANCTFWQYSTGGCYGGPPGCCRLKDASAWAGRGPGAPSGTTSGSTRPLPAAPTCRDGTQCGGTGLWVRWASSLPNATSGNPGAMPFPKSADLLGWEFRSGANPGYGSGDQKRASADTFYPSWAADGNLYTAFTDGNVLDQATGRVTHAKSEAPNAPYTVTHGQFAIVGDDPFGLKMVNVTMFQSSAYPYGGRFPCGSLVYKGTWWYGTYYVPTYPKGPLVGGLLGPLASFRHSSDGGATWAEPLPNATSATDNLFGEAGPLPGAAAGPARVKFGTPHWVDFGQELEHSPDGKAYVVSHGAAAPDSTEMWMLGDQVYMARVAPTVGDIGDGAKWEFYAGGHGAGARWVAGDVSHAAPLVEWVNHTGATTMTYFAAMKKYVLTISTAHTYPRMDNGNFDTYFLESDHITGPWSYVSYMQEFGPQAYFANHPSKFSAKQADTSARTFDAFLMYSANYDPGSRKAPYPNPPNSAYHMNLQQARFSLSGAFATRLEAWYAAERGR